MRNFIHKQVIINVYKPIPAILDLVMVKIKNNSDHENLKLLQQFQFIFKIVLPPSKLSLDNAFRFPIGFDLRPKVKLP